MNSNFISNHHYLPGTIAATGNSRTEDKALESLYSILGLYMVILLHPQFNFILCLKNKASCRQNHLWGWTAAFWSIAQTHSTGPMLLIKAASVSQHLPITCCKSPSELFPQTCRAHLFFGDTRGVTVTVTIFTVSLTSSDNTGFKFKQCYFYPVAPSVTVY